MPLIVDKRFLPKNNTAGSRQKFIDRYKTTIKKRIKEIVGKNSIKDFSQGDKKVKIKIDDLDEPNFGFNSNTGTKDRILIGNKNFQRGHKIDRPEEGQGKGNGGSKDGGGEDDFEFVLTEKEFMDLFFEDLELPDLIKREFANDVYEIKHAGYSRSGGPTSLNIKKTILNSLGRRFIKRKKQEQEDADKKESSLKSNVDQPAFVKDATNCSVCELGQKPNKEGNHTHSGIALSPCAGIQKKKVQFIEDIDLRYNFKDRVEMPTTKAVMVCLMDVSGSMGEREKDTAKRFYILLNRFLKRMYEQVDVVFVRHTEIGEEVDEETFFHDRASGGTIISSGYAKVTEVISKRYNPDQWNIYIAQASDGDNWTDDNPKMKELLIKFLLPVVQYFAYINIGQVRTHNEVFEIMSDLMKSHRNLQAREVENNGQIFEVFRSLFRKKGA